MSLSAAMSALPPPPPRSPSIQSVPAMMGARPHATVYAPQALCLISRYGQLPALTEALQQIYLAALRTRGFTSLPSASAPRANVVPLSVERAIMQVTASPPAGQDTLTQQLDERAAT
jgi:hypothetical protein